MTMKTLPIQHIHDTCPVQGGQHDLSPVALDRGDGIASLVIALLAALGVMLALQLMSDAETAPQPARRAPPQSIR